MYTSTDIPEQTMSQCVSVTNMSACLSIDTWLRQTL